MEWLIEIGGICLGNSVWLMGLFLVGVGIWGLMVKPESINLAVTMMSMTTAGQPQGFALKLRGLIVPVDRTSLFGSLMLAIGVLLLVIGCSIVRAYT